MCSSSNKSTLKDAGKKMGSLRCFSDRSLINRTREQILLTNKSPVDKTLRVRKFGGCIALFTSPAPHR